jgi:hypothetical protein
MIVESYTTINDTTVFNLSRLSKKKELIVFFHGIGDSHLNFECFFSDNNLLDYDLFVADLLGHGFSSSCDDYSFFNQCTALKTQLDKIKISDYKKIIFVPHSMGIVYALGLLSKPFNLKPSAILAIDTTVSSKKSFVAKQVEEVVKTGKNYDLWFEEFKEYVFKELAEKEDALKRYYAGLLMVRKEAFKQNALELRKIVQSESHYIEQFIIGKQFVKLNIPKLYLTTKNNEDDISFLEKNNIEVIRFNTKSHFVAQACLEEFINILLEFLKKSNI